ncbi:xanthine dehydrogenase family protein molybdopterin-binding subunit [Paramagnetospirillum magneticum]|uniref:Aerobic-type carbon monoxide dehydrogenase n=1 Tax=Paramagnetospirillum magneticum (strain ATCC 700264 / AMB-1) TaxID=342108 RepID=Q2W0W4_PARM1|nr:xanthine dehydrogenase family protein molybdopterin-binding subunit [Paramagnetospirillum magneticum]BAE52511.1 Aerobic-type carbon monoxide dehydrogenase [Paramagnetospirillum magneticum AMB-1]
MKRFGFGQSRTRVEDLRFLTGGGCYTDDINLTGQSYGMVVRSLLPHADVTVDAVAARAMPGVLLVLTAAEMAEQGIGPMVCGFLPEDAVPRHPRPVIAGPRTRHAGEPLAFVVAETLAQARDAAEAVLVDYHPLPATPHDAFVWEMGDASRVAEAFARAARVVELDLINNRLAPTAMEPRACLARPLPGGRLELTAGSQGVHEIRDRLAPVLGIAADRLDVITPDVGGGFGLKISPFPEQAMALVAARILDRPVKWTGDRTESFLSDTHGRGHLSTARLALDAEGRFLGLQVETVADLGAYISNYGAFVPTLAGTGMLTGVYDIPAFHARVRAIHTHTTPVDAYRGAGRPEAAYCIERLVDAAAHDTGLSPVEIRKRNFIPPDAFPYASAGRHTYDSGEFARVMDRALERSGWADFASRQADSTARGRKRGIGLAYYIEICGGTSGEDVTLTLSPDGGAEILVGTQSNGQGHETAYAQMVAAELGLAIERVRVIQGDTRRIGTGGGTGGSRSLSQQGGAIASAVESFIEHLQPQAARLLQAERAEFDAGFYRAAGGSVSFAQVLAEAETPLAASLRFRPPAATFPNGCHVCEVEVDPETGETEIVRYTIVDDVGTVLNPLLLKGQIVGGAVQGIGQALLEHAVFDPESTQPLTSSLIDYAVPRAAHIPEIDFSTVEIPCRTHPLGLKGAGEAGTIGAAPAVINALCNALELRHMDMPATPLAVWNALNGKLE